MSISHELEKPLGSESASKTCGKILRHAHRHLKLQVGLESSSGGLRKVASVCKPPVWWDKHRPGRHPG